MKTHRYMSLYTISVLVLLLFRSLPSHAGHYLYKQISLDAGLPSTLTCIFTDSRGFIWTGTQSGLGRFDGREQKKYIFQRGNRSSLPGNRIYWVSEDHSANLWVLTDMGVARYNYYSNNFTPLIHEDGMPCIAYSACRWGDKLLLGGKNEIYLYDERESKYPQRLCRIGAEKDFDVARLALMEDDILLCCSRWQGVYTLNLKTLACRPAPFDCGKEITDMFVDSRRRVWLSPYNQGLRCYEADGRLLASYTTSNSGLSSDIVISMTERKGQIWAGTDGGGISILNPDTGRFVHLEHIPGDKLYSLPTASINFLYKDNYDNIWVGGVYNGLINIREVSMKTYTEALSDRSLGLTNSIVLCLYRESPERIWIGTDGGGINCFNSVTKKFTSYPSGGEGKVTSICEFEQGKLLISLFSEGLFVFDPLTGKITPFEVIDEQTTKTLCKHGYSVYLYRNTRNTILVLGDHVYIYDIKEKKFTVATEEKKNIINWGTLQSVATDTDRTYLFDMKRIYVLEHDTQNLKVLFSCNSEVSLKTVSYDGNGTLWLGTNHGLTRYIPGEGKLLPVHTSLFNEVSSVVCNPGREIWIGAENRLFSYFPDKDRFTLYGETDGVILNEYIPRAQWVAGEDEIYMGGVRGLLHISNRQEADAPVLPELQLSDIILNGESVSGKMGENQEKLTIPWNSNVAIRIMVKEEDVFRRKLYRYRIVGLDDTYTESYNTELVIRLPRQGKYKIMASCTAKDGTWIPDRQILELEVLPPWYQTWWFVGGCIFAMLFLVIQTFRMTLKRKERKLRWVMKEHEQQVYEEKVRFLINVSHELRTPLTLIYAPLRRILKSLSPDDTNYLPLKTIYRQSQRMSSLINMVLDVRKMEVGEAKLRIQPYPFNEWVEHVSKDFVSEGEAEQVDITHRFDPQIGLVSFDRDKCEIVLSNLLVNALKHSPQHSSIVIVTEMLPGEKEVRVSVSDQGCGLKQVNMERLFTRFYQGNGEQSGTGIGLSYSKILVDQHGGSIGAYNNPDAGATFYFILPLRQGTEEIACVPKAYLNELIAEETNELSVEKDEFDLSAYNVLVVDDNADMTDFLKKTLGEYFKSVMTASDGTEALHLFRNHTPDVVVSDVMMPRMNGFQLCAHIKEDIAVSHIPVILLTARDDEQSRKDGYKNGADAYIGKPFEVETLIELIRNRLKNREYIRKRYMNAGPLPVPEDVTFSQADEAFLLKLNKIIQANIADSELDIAFLCKEIGMSRASLYNKLKVLTNISANEYINKFRMEKAVSLIRGTDMAFAEIAERVGFASSSYFSTAFKQYTGETPSQYKKRVKNETEKDKQPPC